MDQLLNSVLGSQGISIILLLGGLLIFIYVMIGPTLWRDWQKQHERQRKLESLFKMMAKTSAEQASKETEEDSRSKLRAAP